MKAEEILVRLYYADLMRSRWARAYKNKNKKEPSKNEIEKIFSKTNEKAEKKKLEEIRMEIKKNPVDYSRWLPRYTEKYCKKIKVDPKKLCIDDSHHNSLNGIKEPRGTKLIDYFYKHKQHSEVQKRTRFVKENWDLFKSSWIIIKKYNNTLEVMNGNHRVMVSCEKGLNEIEALCICAKNDPNKCLILNIYS